MQSRNPLRQVLGSRAVQAIARGAALLLIAGAGLASLLGSGGGISLGFPPCDADWCTSTPLPPPSTVLVQPAYLTALVGSSASFAAHTGGPSGVQAFQWLRSADGVNFAEIPGATSSTLTLAAVNLADEASVFAVRVRFLDGTIRTAQGRLSVSAAPGLVYRDGEFAAANWQAIARASPPGVLPATTTTRVTTGGNPGAWWSMSYQIPPGTGSASVTYLRNEALFDPVAMGAIHVIDYAEDCRTLQTSELMSAESHLVFEQAGRRYAAVNSNVCQSLAWTAVANRGSLRATDFTLVEGVACRAGESCPDFTIGGAPLRFGFRRFVWGAPGDLIEHGIDNWTVTVWRR